MTAPLLGMINALVYGLDRDIRNLWMEWFASICGCTFNIEDPKSRKEEEEEESKSEDIIVSDTTTRSM